MAYPIHVSRLRKTIKHQQKQIHDLEFRAARVQSTPRATVLTVKLPESGILAETGSNPPATATVHLDVDRSILTKHESRFLHTDTTKLTLYLYSPRILSGCGRDYILNSRRDLAPLFAKSLTPLGASDTSSQLIDARSAHLSRLNPLVWLHCRIMAMITAILKAYVSQKIERAASRCVELAPMKAISPITKLIDDFPNSAESSPSNSGSTPDPLPSDPKGALPTSSQHPMKGNDSLNVAPTSTPVSPASAPEPKMFGSSRIPIREPCRYFSRGQCAHGAYCRFSHVIPRTNQGPVNAGTAFRPGQLLISNPTPPTIMGITRPPATLNLTPTTQPAPTPPPTAPGQPSDPRPCGGNPDSDIICKVWVKYGNCNKWRKCKYQHPPEYRR